MRGISGTGEVTMYEMMRMYRAIGKSVRVELSLPSRSTWLMYEPTCWSSITIMLPSQLPSISPVRLTAIRRGGQEKIRSDSHGVS